MYILIVCVCARARACACACVCVRVCVCVCVNSALLSGAIFESATRLLFPAYKQKVIQHEAGHFLLAYLLGCPIQGYFLSAWDASTAGIRGQAGTGKCVRVSAGARAGVCVCVCASVRACAFVCVCVHCVCVCEDIHQRRTGLGRAWGVHCVCVHCVCRKLVTVII